MRPSGLTTFSTWDSTGLSYDSFATRIDVTGGQESSEALTLRLACLLYILSMPAPGLKDTLEHIKDTYTWYSNLNDEHIKPDYRISYKAKNVQKTKAPALSFDDE